MVRFPSRIGVVVGCLLALLSARPAAAVIDATGSWHLGYTLMSVPVEADVDIVQTGSSLTWSNGFSGTIDPATGVFHVERLRHCATVSNPVGTDFPITIDGTFAPDGSSFIAQFTDVAQLGPSCIETSGSGGGQRQPATPSTPNLLAAKKIDLADGTDPARRKLVAKSSDRSLSLGLGDGSADDPTLYGGALRVRTQTGDVMYPLPAANWTSLGANRGYRYKDAKRLAGPVTAVKVRAGRTVTVTAKGASLTHSLANDPQVVEVVLYLGARRTCLGGAGTWKPGVKFTVTNSPAPAECPWP
jgi:hypothetical protein